MARALLEVRAAFTEATDEVQMEHSLFNQPSNNEPGQATTARRAAEALFTPKQERHAPAQEPGDTVDRKPRILPALSPAGLNVAAENSTPEKRHAIPKSQINRIRTWLRCGMTIHQAAEACGMSVSELKDALRAGEWRKREHSFGSART